jgi:hypothetical protein
MPGASHAAIIASLHGRTGKTFLARALVDYCILSGGNPHIFDTDAVARGLYAVFPNAAHIFDMNMVRDQVALFDALATPSSEMSIVEVAHYSFTKFFELLRNTDFILEAQSQNIIPVIFYIPDRNADSFEAGGVLRNTFPECPFVVVDNAFLKEPNRYVQQRPVYRVMRAHKSRYVMPKLADDVVEAMEDRNLSISNFMRQPISSDGETSVCDGLSPDVSTQLRSWVFRSFQEIHRVMTGLANKDGAPHDLPATYQYN